MVTVHSVPNEPGGGSDGNDDRETMSTDRLLPRVTVAVVPREKYCSMGASLGSLVEHTVEPFELIHIEGRTPRSVRRDVDVALAGRSRQSIEFKRNVGPFEAAAAAIDACTTEWLVIADDDVYFREGWLTKLLECADAVGADAVVPLVLIGGAESEDIHVAGGTSQLVETVDGSHRLDREQRHEWEDPNDPAIRLRREETSLLESHCILARTRTWRELGPLEPSVGHAVNVDELSLRFAAIGASTWFEPDAEVVYLFGPGLAYRPADIALMSYMWSERWTARDRDAMAQKYSLEEFFASEPNIRWWLGNHRRVWMLSGKDSVDRVLSRIGLQRLGAVLWKLVELVESASNRLYFWSIVRWARRRDDVQAHLLGRPLGADAGAR